MVSLGVAILGVVFAVAAARLVRRDDLTVSNIGAAVAVMTATTAFGEVQAYGEPAYVGGRINLGAALLLLITGLLLGALGFVVSRTQRWAGILLFVAAAGILIGDAAGWFQRSLDPPYIPQAANLPASR